MESGIDYVAFDSASSELCNNTFSEEQKPVDHNFQAILIWFSY